MKSIAELCLNAILGQVVSTNLLGQVSTAPDPASHATPCYFKNSRLP